MCMSVVSRAGEACGRWQSSEKKEPLLYVFSGAEKWVKEMVSFSTLYDVYPGLHASDFFYFFAFSLLDTFNNLSFLSNCFISYGFVKFTGRDPESFICIIE